MGKLDGKVAFITGAAGGIELGILHVEGANAFMVDVNEGKVVDGQGGGIAWAAHRRP